ncbi:prepilin-type N-terminal cleavage/methylation domain-containing protein [Candidatus Nomurabacteria bacterium]|nr:prepilin-type N-terminal cleavage/methylation domain-containing protein [Candidatus Nomurabacteria bacterium]
MKPHEIKSRGFSLVEVIIVSAISTIVFGALLLSFKYSLDLMNQSKFKLTALSVANDRMEYFRSLPYDDVGTVAGIPSGTIPQNSSTTLNGIEFAERVLVEYVDDPADGLDVADSNGILADYKRVKLEYTWNISGETRSISLVSNIVPRSIETDAGGGTVRINVIDENSTLLPGASVQLINTVTGPVDVTRFTNVSGSAIFSGAPAASDYEVVVTANIGGKDYSTAETYQTTVANPNPIVSPFAVLEADVSTLTFQIGELSDLDITTFSSLDDDLFREDFSDLLSVDSSGGVSISGGALVLEDSFGVYDNSGFVFLGPIAPVPLLNWDTLRIATNIPSNTSHQVQFYVGAGVGLYALIPDSELPGNSVGFSSSIVDISDLDPVTYPEVYVGIDLETTDTNVTPEIDEVSVFYRQSETILPNVSFDIHGNKIIGTDASAKPIYKYSDSLSTNGVGELSIADLEFDDYIFNFLGAYDIASACPAHPYTQVAGEDGELYFVLVGDAVNTLRVSVVDAFQQALPGVSVNLTRSGYNVTEVTDSCGQAFFTGGVSAGTDYTISVSATGYNNETVTPFEINDDTVITITLTE